MESMKPFRDVLADRHGYIKKYKSDSGKKIAGYFCDYLPEEILWAAGYVPIRITGGRGNVMKADRHMQVNVCSYARRCLDQALDGVFGYLDAVTVPHTCDVITKMYDVWAYRIKDPNFLHYFWVPHKVFDPAAQTVMEGEIRRLKKSVEDHLKTTISDDSIEEAIAVYDRSRALLKKVYELRRSDPPLISGVDAFTVALSSILAPKDVHSDWMEALLKEAETAKPTLNKRPRIIVSASILDDIELIEAIEKTGSWVVSDEVCSGTRYFWDLVGQTDGKQIKALAKRYLNKIPCPRSVNSMTPRFNHLLNLAKDYNAGGVIFYILRCCDAHLYQHPILSQRLQKEGLKAMYLQGDQTIGINESHTTRLAAFTEMLES